MITDLDDTLRRRILGEVGAEGISWDLDHHSQMHALYQRLLGALATEGALIAVASKNDPPLVEKAFRRKDLALSADIIFPMEVKLLANGTILFVSSSQIFWVLLLLPLAQFSDVIALPIQSGTSTSRRPRMDEQERRLATCFLAAFPELHWDEIADASSANVNAWDSVAVVTLLAVVEEEFGISLGTRRSFPIRFISAVSQLPAR